MTANIDEKVLHDLSALSEKIALCQSMLVNAGGPSSIDADEALLAVIGFLEACVPRMVELIEAAAQGELKPATFEECLVVNDRLTNVLTDAGKDPKDRHPLTPVAAAAATGTNISAAGDSATPDEGVDINRNLAKMSLVAGGKTTGLDSGEDPFAGGLDLLAPTPPADVFRISESMGSAGSVEATTKANADTDDDFDAFFRDRTEPLSKKSDN